jgi:hypothetical protein
VPRIYNFLSVRELIFTWVEVAAFPVILLEVKAIVPVASGNVYVRFAVNAAVTISP